MIGLHPAGADQREAAPQPPTSASLVFLPRNGLKRDRSTPGRGRPTGGGTPASSYSGGRSSPIALTHKSCYRATLISCRALIPGADGASLSGYLGEQVKISGQCAIISGSRIRRRALTPTAATKSDWTRSCKVVLKAVKAKRSESLGP